LPGHEYSKLNGFSTGELESSVVDQRPEGEGKKGQMRVQRTTWHSLGANLFLGAGFALGLPPLVLWPLALVCLAVLLARDSRRGPLRLRAAAVQGFCFGLGYFGVALHWIGFAFLVDAEADLWMMPFAVGGLAALMAAYWSVGFVLAHALARRGLALWLVLPAVLAVMEVLRGVLFTGFPWAAPGLMAVHMGGVLQLAALVGQPGLTLLVLLWGAALGQLVVGVGVRRVLPVLVLAVLPLAYGWGEVRLRDADTVAADAPVVRLVQPNISQSDKWRSDNAALIFETLLRQTASPSALRPRLVVWPESAVPFLLDEHDGALQRLALALADDQLLLAGAIRREKAAADCASCADRYFTSILQFDGQANVLGVYDKWRLVPGGEFLPLAWLLEPLGFRKVVALPESFDAGAGPAALDLPGIGRAVMLICYEAIFPDRLVPSGPRPRLIVNVTNDGWFGRSSGPYQHVAQVRMRAVEQGLPVVRAANTGISVVYDGYGRSIGQTTLETEATVDVHLPSALAITLFASFGLLGAAMLVLCCLALAMFDARKTYVSRGGG
jgi:apolipoprotein N-acyltransferase